jgi:hypothetical protein
MEDGKQRVSDSNFKVNASLLIFFCKNISVKVGCDFTELLKGGFEVFNDLMGENVAIEEFVRFFEASSRSQKMSPLALLRL